MVYDLFDTFFLNQEGLQDVISYAFNDDTDFCEIVFHNTALIHGPHNMPPVNFRQYMQEPFNFQLFLKSPHVIH